MASSGPRHASDYPDRFKDCEASLEAGFQCLVECALDAGWDEGEICAALTSLADNRILALIANEEVAQEIASAECSGNVLKAKP